MPCLRKQILVRLFFNGTFLTAKFLFLFFYHISLLLAKLFLFFFRTQDEYDADDIIYEEDDEDETMPELEEDDEQEYRYSYVKGDHLVAEITNDGEELVYYPKELQNYDDVDDHDDNLHRDNSFNNENNVSQIHHGNSNDSLSEDPVEYFDFDDEGDQEAAFDIESSSMTSEDVHHRYDNDIGQQDEYEVINEDYTTSSLESMQDYKSCESNKREATYNKSNHENFVDSQPIYDDMPHRKSPSIETKLKELGTQMNAAESNNRHGETVEKKREVVKEDTNFTRDERFLIFAPPKSEARKMQGIGEENHVIFEDTYTVGSTSKSSSDWRSSLRDSGTDDPFSSSSRRSCPKWESYAVYQKYDEEMMFLDRISAQKLHETESLKSFQMGPRSISQRIVHKLANKNKKKSKDDAIYKKNPYNELEVAYVAQICLAWETLNWNYANFHRKQISRNESLLDPGCPALVAQQFQQFQVLLQRYIESEPYERGKRPEIYTRMRSVSPKLLQVPEYHDYEGEEQEVVGGRITSASFLQILEDAIQTFMNFLNADRETRCELITVLFKKRPKGSIDPTVINVFKKQLKKKKLKIRELHRSRICFKKRKLTKEEEMEILMGLIDLKVVSRVLRMVDLTQEQLHWCEAKMGKLRLLDGKLHRDSSTLFFPAH